MHEGIKVMGQEIRAVLETTGKEISQIFFMENKMEAIKEFERMALLCNVFYNNVSVMEVDVYV